MHTDHLSSMFMHIGHVSSTMLVTWLCIQGTCPALCLLQSYTYRPPFKHSAYYIVMLQATFQAQCLLHAYRPPPPSIHKLYILPAQGIYLSDNWVIAQRLSCSGRERRARRFTSWPRAALHACEWSIQSVLGLLGLGKVKRSQYQLSFVKRCLLFKTVISCTNTESKDISFFPPQYSSLQLWQIWRRLLWSFFFYFLYWFKSASVWTNFQF
jgi:hypothetical protein